MGSVVRTLLQTPKCTLGVRKLAHREWEGKTKNLLSYRPERFQKHDGENWGGGGWPMREKRGRMVDTC